MALTIRVAMLNADTPVPNVRPRHCTYGSMFKPLLSAAARRFSPNIRVESEDFAVVDQEYPADPSVFDALVITGSAASSYDRLPWIRRLDAWLADAYLSHPHLRIFGSCFGHQVVCQSLLRHHGARVQKDPKGWEIGVHEIRLTDEFTSALGPAPPSAAVRMPTPAPAPAPLDHAAKPTASPAASLRLQFVHSDHVVLPSGLPTPWVLVGSTPHCAVQGVYLPGRVLTYQGHFEFDRLVNSETVKVFGEKWDPAVLSSCLSAVDRDDDSERAADMVIRFLLQGRGVPEQGPGGLLTPPVFEKA